MSANLTIALTIAFAMIVNAGIVVARSAAFLPSELMMKSMESEGLPNKLSYEEVQRYLDGWPYEKDTEQAASVPGFMHSHEKSVRIDEQLHNSLDDQLKSGEPEEYPEPLPAPMALSGDFKAPAYKKSGSHYQMTICLFKVCNMGRKRDTHNQIF